MKHVIKRNKGLVVVSVEEEQGDVVLRSSRGFVKYGNGVVRLVDGDGHIQKRLRRDNLHLGAPCPVLSHHSDVIVRKRSFPKQRILDATARGNSELEALEFVVSDILAYGRGGVHATGAPNSGEIEKIG